MKKANLAWRNGILQMDIHKDGYLIHLTYDQYYDVCTKNNIPLLPTLDDTMSSYQISPETYIPSFLVYKTGEYQSIDVLNIKTNTIVQLFNNFELIIRQTNMLQDPKYYPFAPQVTIDPAQTNYSPRMI
jgi:hypothetical protein